MKKFICCFFIYIIFCLLQFFFSQYFRIFGVYPNFILIAVVSIGLLRGSFSAQIAGFLFGLTWDVFSTDIFAVRALLFTIIGYCCGKLRKNLDGSSVSAQCFIILIAGIIYNFGLYFINSILLQDISMCNVFNGVFKYTFKILANLVVTPGIFYVLRKLLKGI